MAMMRPLIAAGPIHRQVMDLIQSGEILPADAVGSEGLVCFRSSSFLFNCWICFWMSEICCSRVGSSAKAANRLAMVTGAANENAVVQINQAIVQLRRRCVIVHLIEE